MISGFSTHTAAEFNDLRVRAEKAEAASAAYKQQVAELKATLATVANGFVAGVEYLDATAAEKAEALQSLLAEMLSWWRLDDFGGIRCWEASVDDPTWMRWLDRAREAGVAGLPGADSAGEDPQDGDDDGS